MSAAHGGHPPAAPAHPRRQQILEHVRRNPGSNFLETCRATGMAWGTMKHHLSVLVKGGLLVARRNGRTVHLFENDGAHGPDSPQMALRCNPTLLAIYTWLQEAPASTPAAARDAMRAFGWCKSTTHHRLKRLVANGLAIRLGDGRSARYTAVQIGGDPAGTRKGGTRGASAPGLPDALCCGGP